MPIRRIGAYVRDADLRRDIDQLLSEVNRQTDPITFTVAAPGTEVAITHGLGRVPVGAVPIVTPSVTGQGVVYPGTTAWTSSTIYLTATAVGVYAILARR